MGTSVASYSEWNNVIVDFFTSGIRDGDPVYLTADDDSLAYIGSHYLGLPPEEARNDFITAVKERCTERVGTARCVRLKGARGISPNGTPNSVSFLAAMVLAAHEMQADEGQHIDGTNYFRRFTELLDLSSGQQSRPMGFVSGEEGELWRTWNSWIALNGFKPTAHGGVGAHVYIDYPIEQALLRKDDRNFVESKMRRAFTSPQDRMLDETQLASWLMRQGFSRKHLQTGFHNADPDRVAAFVDSAFRIYQAIDWSASNGGQADQRNVRIKLTGGIIRKVSIRGTVQYQLLARQPSRWKSVELKVLADGEYHSLVPLKADLFAPLWAVSPFPDDPLEFQVDGDPFVESLVFPRRVFWILTSDPDDPLGQIGTWERYPNLLGRKFWILLRGEDEVQFSAELEKYKAEKLIDWDKKEVNEEGWAEYRGCMILSRAWDCIVPSAGTEALYDALLPTMFANIGLSGGIKVPDGQGWVEGFPPSITIYGFERDFKVQVVSEMDNTETSFEIQQQVPRVLLECLAPGSYKLMASWHGRPVASRSFRIIPWDNLEISKNAATIEGKMGGLSLHGASIELSGSGRME